MKRLFQKLMNKEEGERIVIVSGLPRSGTSMMMRMLAAGGIEPLTDEEREADKDNPRGYYEFERVKAMDKGDTAWVAQARGKAVKVVSPLLKHLPDEHAYRVVFVRRAMPEILASQKKMLVHRGNDPEAVDDAEMAELFGAHLAQIEAWLAERPNFDVLYLKYDEVIADPVRAAAQIKAFLGDGLDERAMAEVVDPNLYRNRRDALAS